MKEVTITLTQLETIIHLIATGKHTVEGHQAKNLHSFIDELINLANKAKLNEIKP